MSSPISPGSPEKIQNHQQFHEKLENLAKKNGSLNENGSLNGYLITNKRGELERVPLEKYVSPETFDQKQELKLAIIYFITDNKLFVEREDIQLIRNLAENAGLAEDRSIEQFIQDISIKSIKQIINPETKLKITKEDVKQIKTLAEDAHLIGDRTDEQLIDDFSKGIFKPKKSTPQEKPESSPPPPPVTSEEGLKNLNLEQTPTEEESKDLKQEQGLFDQGTEAQAEKKPDEPPAPLLEKTENQTKDPSLLKIPDIIPDAKPFQDFEKYIEELNDDHYKPKSLPIDELPSTPEYKPLSSEEKQAKADAASEALREKIQNRNFKSKAEKEEEKSALTQEGQQEFDLDQQDLAQPQQQPEEKSTPIAEKIQEKPIDVSQLNIPVSEVNHDKLTLEPINLGQEPQKNLESPALDVTKTSIAEKEKIETPKKPMAAPTASSQIKTAQTYDDLVAALLQEKPPIAMNDRSSTQVVGEFYEKMIGKPFQKETASDYEIAIFNILNAVKDLKFEEVDAWLGMIQNPSNQFTLLATAYRLAKALETPIPPDGKLFGHLQMKSKIEKVFIPKLEERIQNIGLQDVSKINLDQLQWNVTNEPYGLIYESFFNATGKQFNKDTADKLDEFVYDIFSFTQDGDLDALKNLLNSYLEKDDLSNQLAILQTANKMSTDLLGLALEKQNELEQVQVRNNDIAKKQKSITKYIGQLNATKSLIEEKLSALKQTEDFLGKSIPALQYSKDKAGEVSTIFQKEEATEERTRSVLKMAFAIITIFGTYTQPMFKHLERQQLDFGMEEHDIDPFYGTSPPLPTPPPKSIPPGKIELNGILFDLPEEGPSLQEPPLAIAATPHQPTIRPQIHLTMPESIETPTHYRMVNEYGVVTNIPRALPSPPPRFTELNDAYIKHHFAELSQLYPTIGDTVLIPGATPILDIPIAAFTGLATLAAVHDAVSHYLFGGKKISERIEDLKTYLNFKKPPEPSSELQGVEEAPQQAPAPAEPPAGVAELVNVVLPEEVDERQQVKEFFTEALRERSQEILNEIKPTLSSLSSYKELLGHAIDVTANDPVITRNIFNYIQRELESKSPLSANLGANLLERFVQAQIGIGNADQVLKYAFTLKDEYLDLQTAKEVVKSWDIDTFIEKMKNKSSTESLLLLKGAVLAEIPADDLFLLIREISLKDKSTRPNFQQLIEFCVKHNQKLLNDLSGKFTPEQISKDFYRSLKNPIDNAIRNIQTEDAPLTPPFKEKVVLAITKIIETEDKDEDQFEKAKDEFTALAMGNLEDALQVLRQVEESKNLEQKHLDVFISPKMIQSLKPSHVGIFQNIYKSSVSSTFNKMIHKTLYRLGANGINTALETLRNQKSELDRKAILDSIWSGPEYLKEKRSEMGLQVYAKITYALLFPYIQEQLLQFDGQGNLTTSENDPARMLHKLVCQKFIEDTPRESVINMLLFNPGNDRGVEETQNTIRTIVATADPQTTIDLLGSYLRQMSEGDTPRAKSAETELMQHLKKVDVARLPEVIEKAINEGSVKGILVAENLFESITNYETALDAFERSLRSPNQDPKVIRKMANRLYELSGGRTQKISEVSELVERSIQGFIQSGSRANILADSLVELLIDRDPKKAADVIRSTLEAKLPFFHTQMDSLLDKLAEKSPEISWGLIQDLFRHENIETKASGSLLFAKLLASDPSKLTVVQPEDFSVAEQPIKYLHQKAGAATGVNLIDETVIAKEISSNPQKALTDIMSLLKNPSLRLQNQGAMLLSTLIIEKGKNLAFAKTIMKELINLTDAQLQLEMAALIAKLHENETQSLESFLEDDSLRKLFFEGFACINPPANVFNGYLQGIKRKGEDIQPYLITLKKYSPETAAELASILKQSLSSNERNAAQFLEAENIQQASLTSFKANLTARIENLMSEPGERTAIEEECLELFKKNPQEFSLIMQQLANEIPDTDNAVSAVSFPLMKAIEMIDNPAILKRLIALQLKEAVSKFKEANIQPHDEQSRIQKFVSLSVNPLKALIANHPYLVLGAMSQVNLIDPDLKDAIYRELIPILGKQNEVKIPAAIHLFIEKIFIDMLQSKQPTLALDVANHYADIAVNPRPLQRMIERLSTASQDPTFKEKLTDVAFKAIKHFNEKEGDAKLIAPIANWLIDNHPQKAFHLILEDLNHPNPAFEKSLKELTVHLAHKELSFAPILFKTMIEHDSVNVRAAAADLYLTLERLGLGNKEDLENIPVGTRKKRITDIKPKQVQVEEEEIVQPKTMIPTNSKDKINSLLGMLTTQNANTAQARTELQAELKNIVAPLLPNLLENLKNAGIDTGNLLFKANVELTMAVAEAYSALAKQNSTEAPAAEETLKKLLARTSTDSFPDIANILSTSGGSKAVNTAKYILKESVKSLNLASTSKILTTLRTNNLMSHEEVASLVSEQEQRLLYELKNKKTTSSQNKTMYHFLSKNLAEMIPEEKLTISFQQTFGTSSLDSAQNEVRTIFRLSLLNRISAGPLGMEAIKQLSEESIAQENFESVKAIRNWLDEVQSQSFSAEALLLSNKLNDFIQKNNPLLILESPTVTQEQIAAVVAKNNLQNINTEEDVQRMQNLIQSNPQIEQAIANLCVKDISDSLPLLESLQQAATVSGWEKDAGPIILDAVANVADSLSIYTKFSYDLVISQIEQKIVVEENPTTKINLELILTEVCKNLMNASSLEEINATLSDIANEPEKRATFNILISLVEETLNSRFNELFDPLQSQFDDIFITFDPEASFEILKNHHENLSQIQTALQNLEIDYQHLEIPTELQVLTNSVNQLKDDIKQSLKKELPNQFEKVLHTWGAIKSELLASLAPTSERLSEIAQEFASSIDKWLGLTQEYTKLGQSLSDEFEKNFMEEMKVISSLISHLETEEKRKISSQKLEKEIANIEGRIDTLVHEIAILEQEERNNLDHISTHKPTKTTLRILEQASLGRIEQLQQKNAEKERLFNALQLKKEKLEASGNISQDTEIKQPKKIAKTEQSKIPTKPVKILDTLDDLEMQKSVRIEEINALLQGIPQKTIDSLTSKLALAQKNIKEKEDKINELQNKITVREASSDISDDLKRGIIGSHQQEIEEIKVDLMQKKLSEKKILNNILPKTQKMKFGEYLQLNKELAVLKQNESATTVTKTKEASETVKEEKSIKKQIEEISINLQGIDKKLTDNLTWRVKQLDTEISNIDNPPKTYLRTQNSFQQADEKSVLSPQEKERMKQEKLTKKRELLGTNVATHENPLSFQTFLELQAKLNPLKQSKANSDLDPLRTFFTVNKDSLNELFIKDSLDTNHDLILQLKQHLDSIKQMIVSSKESQFLINGIKKIPKLRNANQYILEALKDVSEKYSNEKTYTPAQIIVPHRQIQTNVIEIPDVLTSKSLEKLEQDAMTLNQTKTATEIKNEQFYNICENLIDKIKQNPDTVQLIVGILFKIIGFMQSISNLRTESNLKRLFGLLGPELVNNLSSENAQLLVHNIENNEEARKYVYQSLKDKPSLLIPEPFKPLIVAEEAKALAQTQAETIGATDFSEKQNDFGNIIEILSSFASRDVRFTPTIIGLIKDNIKKGLQFVITLDPADIDMEDVGKFNKLIDFEFKVLANKEKFQAAVQEILKESMDVNTAQALITASKHYQGPPLNPDFKAILQKIE